MNRKQFIKDIESKGCKLSRNGSRHDIYYNPNTGKSQPVPRHSEIDNHLAKHIKKYLGII